MAVLSEISVASPIGSLRLIADDNALWAILFADHRRPPSFSSERVQTHPVLDRASRELEEYFQGNRSTFSVPLYRETGTAFQRAVWNALEAIPFGEHLSYGQLATRLGNPKAVRAVGSANGRNPLSIVVPCHRVFGSDGQLTGYAGGMSTKRWLLDHEREVLARGRAASRALQSSLTGDDRE